MSLGRRDPSLIGAVAVMLLGTGCYHAGKDALARSAQADFKEAHISSSLDDELAHSKELLKAELTATQRSVEARRDEAVARILDFRWGGRPRPTRPAARSPAARRSREIRHGARSTCCSNAWVGGRRSPRSPNRRSPP